MTTLALRPIHSSASPVTPPSLIASRAKKKTHEHQADSTEGAAPSWLIDSLKHMNWNSALDDQTMLRVGKILREEQLSYATALELQQALIGRIQTCEQERMTILRNRIVQTVGRFPELFKDTVYGRELAQSAVYTATCNSGASWSQLKSIDKELEVTTDTWLSLGIR